MMNVLNLVRHHTDRMPIPSDCDPEPLNEDRVAALIKSAAALVQRASLASPEILEKIANRETVCHSRELLDKHCGNCPEHGRTIDQEVV